MTITVLIKVVPEIEEICYDPLTNNMKRDGAELVLNPFDWRALVVALNLRRAGEKIEVISMGPPGAKGPLHECLGIGADAVVHICDRALAGSDTLATARVLSAALRKRGFDLILAGRHSIDSSTGQVTSQLAEMLSVPMADGVLKISWHDRSHLSVTTEDDSGEEDLLLPTPCLVAVGEKIAKPRHATPEELAAASSKSYTVWEIKDLSLTQSDVGPAGSPTEVTGLLDSAPRRSPVILKDGPPHEMAEKGATFALELLSRRRIPQPLSSPLEAVQSTGGPGREMIVLVSGKSGNLDKASIGILPEVFKLEGYKPSALVVGNITDEEMQSLRASGVDRCYTCHPPSRRLCARGVAEVVARVHEERPDAAAILFASDPWSREVAGRVSARLGLGLVGDAIGLSRTTDGNLVFQKPSFGGGLIASVICKTTPALATVGHGALGRAGTVTHAPDINFIKMDFEIPQPEMHFLGTRSTQDGQFGDLATADAVVGIGMGIGGKERIADVMRYIAPLRAALGGSRKVIDSGWLPHQLQIGMTGSYISPSLYIAVALKGKLTHTVGVKRAKVIVAINSDPSEPVFQYADVGIVGKWDEILPLLVDSLTSRGFPDPLAVSK